MDYKNFFSQRLIELRKSQGISQKALGNILDLTDAAITMLEKGKRSPSFEVLCAIAEHFNVSIDYLVGLSDDPKIH